MDTGGYENGHVMRVVCQTNVLSWARLDGTHGGRIVASGSAPSMSVPLSIFCCGHGDVAWASGAANMRLYSFTVSNAAGVAQCDFVPCRRKSDGAVGLYDTVRNRFYGNESSNSFAGFTAAPVSSTLPAGYTRLTYIESTYKQALHTGYIPTYGDKIECDVKISSTHASSYLTLFGKQDDTSVNCYYFTIQTDATQGIGFGRFSFDERIIVLINNQEAAREVEIEAWKTGMSRLKSSVLIRQMISWRDGFDTAPEEVTADVGILRTTIPGYGAVVYYHKCLEPADFFLTL